MKTKPNDGGPLPEAIISTFTEIAAEIQRATTKFPTWPTDGLHACGVVIEEAGELQKEVMQLTYESHKSTKETVRKEAVQLAAMSIRFLMSLDRYEYTPGRQHNQSEPHRVPCAARDRGDYMIGHREGCPNEYKTEGDFREMAAYPKIAELEKEGE